MSISQTPIGELIDLVKEQEHNRARKKRGERALVSDAEAAQLEYDSLLKGRQEMVRLLANALSSGEGWSVKDEALAAKIVRECFPLNGAAK